MLTLNESCFEVGQIVIFDDVKSGTGKVAQIQFCRQVDGEYYYNIRLSTGYYIDPVDGSSRYDSKRVRNVSHVHESLLTACELLPAAIGRSVDL